MSSASISRRGKNLRPGSYGRVDECIEMVCGVRIRNRVKVQSTPAQGGPLQARVHEQIGDESVLCTCGFDRLDPGLIPRARQ